MNNETALDVTLASVSVLAGAALACCFLGFFGAFRPACRICQKLEPRQVYICPDCLKAVRGEGEAK